MTRWAADRTGAPLDRWPVVGIAPARAGRLKGLQTEWFLTIVGRQTGITTAANNRKRTSIALVACVSSASAHETKTAVFLKTP